MNKCSQANCHAPATTCALGNLDRTECHAWNNVAEGAADIADLSDGISLPWSGSALGLRDLAFVAGRSKPIVVGVVGPQNAGKTTLLAAWYLLLGRGSSGRGSQRFSGSYTFAGWEAVANRMLWRPGASPSFPAHTASRSGRMPGLLHLSFRTGGERARDFLLTDAPGEWFQKWGVNREAAEGAGAAWVAENADIFLLIADREALSGEKKGAARNAFQQIAHRLASVRGERPVALVWTKDDVPIGTEMEAAIREVVNSRIADAREFSVSVKPTDGDQNVRPDLLALYEWIQSFRPMPIPLPEPKASSIDPLFIFGRR